MNHDEVGWDVPGFQVIGPHDGDVEEILRAHPGWSDTEIAQELSKAAGYTIGADMVADARSRAWA